MAERLRALADKRHGAAGGRALMGFIDKVTDRVVVMAAGKEFFERHAGRRDKGP